MDSDTERYALAEAKSGTRRRLNWSIVGVVIALILGFPTVYSVVHRASSEILFEVTNEANVLDVHKPLRDLAISFKGEDIQRKNLNLRVISIRVLNSGELDVLQNQYDAGEPWGFLVDGGKIVDQPRFVGSNSRYIERRLSGRLSSDNGQRVNFPKVIIERGKFFRIEILVLHPRDVQPRVVPYGKIAGMDSFPVKRVSPDNGGHRFWPEVVSGGPWVNVARTLLSLGLVVVVTGLVSMIASIYGKIRFGIAFRRRKEELAAFHSSNSQQIGNAMSLLKEVYQYGGAAYLLALQRELDDPWLWLNLTPRDNPLSYAQLLSRMRYWTHSEDLLTQAFLLRELASRGIVEAAEDHSVAVAPGFRETLDELVAYLQAKQR